ncbi:PAS domain-containing protein [Maricaulis sp. CAU 1757]
MLKQNEEARLAALRSLDLLDSDPEEGFDSVTDLAVALTGAKMAAVSLVDHDRQWFKSNINIPAPETPREYAFCDHAIRQDEIFHIPDALEDPRFRDNPLVTGSPNIRTYAGVPLHEPGGHRIGTLCVLHDEPLTLDDGQKHQLAALTRVIEERLVSRQRTRELEELNVRLRESEGRLDLAMSGLTAGVWELDVQTGMVFASNRYLEIIGYPPAPGDARGVRNSGGEDRLFHWVHPDDMERVRTAVQRTLRLGEPFEVEYRHRHAAGGYVHLRGRGQAQTGPDGRARRIAGSAEDITEAVGLREDRSRAHERLQTVAELGGIGCWETDLETGERVWDEMTCRILETEPGYEHRAGRFDRFYPDSHRDELKAFMEQIVRSGESWDFEAPLVTASGRRIWCRSVGRCEMRDGRTVRLIGSFQDITERKQKADELETLASRLSLALRTSGIGVWELNLETGAHWWDPGSKELFGLPLDEDAPSMEVWRSRIHPDDVDWLLGRVDQAVAARAPYDAQYRVVRPDGSMRHVRSLGVFRTDFEGQTIFSGVNVDISESVESAAEMERQRAEAEAANQAKSQFLANMSHEIRTPLNGVIGMTQVLRRTSLDDEQLAHVATLEASGRALMDLIEDVLDISKIESGMLKFSASDAELAAVIDDAVAVIQPLAEAKEIGLEARIDPELRCCAHTDHKRLRQVLINILGNAVKFTAEGRVVLEAGLSGPGRARFVVTDTGPGIPAERQADVFQRFAQIDNSTTRQHSGSGLGLAICRELVAMAGGEIGVESTVGEGSRFWFEWPFAAPERRHDHEAGQALLAPSRAMAAGRRLLVVDDVSTNLVVARALLGGAGYQVEVASGGPEALAALEAEVFDAVLMDIQMPVMSGDEAIGLIRQSTGPNRDIPIFAVTADATSGAAERYRAVGATGYLPKPLDLPAVTAALQAVFDVPKSA